MKPSPRARRWFIAAAIGFVVVAVVGFLVLPPVIKAQVQRRLSAELGRTVTLGKVKVNPLVLSLTLENFEIREKDGAGSFLGWQRLYVNFDALASLGGDWVLGDIELDGFHAAVTINPDRTFNFSDLLAKVTAPPASSGTPPAKPGRPICVGRLAVSQARVEFNDESRKLPFKSVVGPVTFVLTGFRTAGAKDAPYHFEAVTEAGEEVAWTGDLSAEPLASHGEFAVENLLLRKYTPYFENRVQADLLNGKLSLRGHYEAAWDSQKRILKLTGGELHLRDLRIQERATGQLAFDLPTLDILGIEADGVARKATVASVGLAGGHLAIRREKDGSVNLLTLASPAVHPAAAPAVAGTATAPAALPEVEVGEVTLKDFKIDLTDNAAPRPARLALSDLQFSLKNVTLADGAVMPLQLSLQWAPQGAVKTTGSITIKPELTADLQTEVTALAILPLSPYLEQFVNARVTQGTVSTSHSVHLAMPGGRPVVTFAGDVAIEKFGLVDGVHNEEFTGFAGLALKGINVTTAPQIVVALDEINIAGPYTRLVINAVQATPDAPAPGLWEASNVAAILKPTSSASAPAPVAVTARPAPAAPAPRITVGRVVITNGEFSFVDRSLEPHVRTAISQFGGSISGLASENLARADVDLKGVVDGAGPVAISGKLDPLGPVTFVDLKIDFKNVDLLPMSPYAGKFAGYEIARGKLGVDSKISVQGKKIDATNLVTLHQFTFGPATNSPEATGLPVRLGVALLKDADGKIVVDLPVQGSLDDPTFRIGKVVMRVVVNLLTKAATSPFALVGSMFGGGGEELAFQEFAPGESVLLPAELPKLDTLVKALNNRPALSLGLEGSYDVAADGYALKRQKLADLVRRKVWESRHKTNPNIPPPEQLVIPPEEHAAMVKELFNETFPPGTRFGAPLPPEPSVAAPPPPPPPGLVRRAINVVTFQERRAQRAAKKEEERRAAARQEAVAAAKAAGLPLDEMTGRLAEAMTVTDNDLRALATARAQRVRDQLITAGHIAADRLFLAQAANGAKQNKGPRVFLDLQ